MTIDTGDNWAFDPGEITPGGYTDPHDTMALGTLEAAVGFLRKSHGRMAKNIRKLEREMQRLGWPLSAQEYAGNPYKRRQFARDVAHEAKRRCRRPYNRAGRRAHAVRHAAFEGARDDLWGCRRSINPDRMVLWGCSAGSTSLRTEPLPPRWEDPLAEWELEEMREADASLEGLSRAIRSTPGDRSIRPIPPDPNAAIR